MCMKKVFCFSVEPDHNRKALSRHGSVEIFDGKSQVSLFESQVRKNKTFSGAYNLTVPNKMSRHASTSKLEEIHADHIKIVGEAEEDTEDRGTVSASSSQQQESQCQESSSTLSSQSSTSQTLSSVTQNQSSITQNMSSTSQNLSYATQNQSSITQNQCSTTQNMSSITTSSTSVQKSETFSSSSSSSLETSQQLSSQVSGPLERDKYFYKADFLQVDRYNVLCACLLGISYEVNFAQARARHGSGTQDAVVTGHKFNISSGLKQRSRHVSGAVEAAGVGSALRGLDTALEKIALQQQQESQQYVAKVTNQNTAYDHVTQCSPLIGPGVQPDLQAGLSERDHRGHGHRDQRNGQPARLQDQQQRCGND